MGVRRLGCTFLALVCALLGGLTLRSAPALACPNEAFRAGPSSNLPDCRAYEMVSPLDKNGYFVTSGHGIIDAWGQAAATGGAVAYTANGAFAGAVTNAASNFYLASRASGLWSTEPLLPPQAFSYNSGLTEPVFAAYSPSLSKGILLDATDSPPIVSGEQQDTVGAANLFLRDNVTGAYSLLNTAAAGVHPLTYQPTVDGASADFGTIIFDANGALTPEAPAGGVDNLYESVAGAISLVSQIPPAGEPSCGAFGPACRPAAHGGKFGSENATSNISASGSLVHAISSDGSRIFFTVEGHLYVRENATTTVQLDAPHGPGPGGGGLWATAAGDGSKVFFYDDASAGLTDDTVSGSGENLYSYDTLTETLTDLTPGPEADVQGLVNAASEDGTYLYFVAHGDLTGDEEDNLGHRAEAGAENLYLSHNGVTSFIDNLSEPTNPIDSRALLLAEHNAARVTPDGRHLAYFAKDLGSDGSRALHAELFEYNADSRQLSHLCMCGRASFPQPEQSTVDFPRNQSLSVLQYTRAISDDGSRVFLETEEALLPRDTNGQEDIYEYEQNGAGSCDVLSGCLYLISSGNSAQRSDFVDASASGEDVFFTTSQQLVPSDTDGATDLYDARVAGGITPPPSPPPCVGDGCLNVPPAPIDATPASLTFSGAGNLPGEVTPRITPKPLLTNAEKLAKAVKACRKKPKRLRKRCEAQERRSYAKTANQRSGARRANTDPRPAK